MSISFAGIIDLSQALCPFSPAPGPGQPDFRTLVAHGPDSLFQLMWFGMNDHVGTHMDAPLHFIPGGEPIDAARVERLAFMPGVFLDFEPGQPYQCIDESAVISALSGLGPVAPGACIIVHCGEAWYANAPENQQEAYFASPYLTPEAALRLADLRPAVVAVNGPTVDNRQARERPIHRILLERGIHIVEGLVNTAALRGKRFYCAALPLKLAGLTGSPVRVVAYLV